MGKTRDGDHLWSGEGVPDHATGEIMESLRACRLSTTEPPEALLRGETPASYRRNRVITIASLAAAVAVVSGVFWSMGAGGGLRISPLEGRPMVDGAALRSASTIDVGEGVVTDAQSRARIDIDEYGYLDVQPGTRLGLVDRTTERRFRLSRGAIEVAVTAPPRLLVVETPNAVAVDLGCAYTLEVTEDNGGLLAVQSGWVAIETAVRTSFIPGGARCVIEPTRGPGLPVFDDATPKFRELAQSYDETANPELIAGLLDAARPRDTLTLWHLVSRVDGGVRPQVVDQIIDYAGLPRDIRIESILALEESALEQWRVALSATW
ncbi:MAG: FecR domain-containing protein [Phycisphaerales bacterium]